MAESLGIINTLPDASGVYNVKKPPLAQTRATDNCFFGFKELPSEKDLLSPDFGIETPTLTFKDLINKIKNKIEESNEKAKLWVDNKLISLINPNPVPSPRFPIDVEHLSPKMKMAVMKLYYYAKQEGINFTINDGYRSEEQQKELKKKSKYAASCSPHVREIAIDIHIEGKTVEEAQSDLQKLGAYWKKITGGRWGGDWHGKEHEPWHFDLKQKRQKLCLSKINKIKTSEGA